MIYLITVLATCGLLAALTLLAAWHESRGAVPGERIAEKKENVS